MSLHYSADAAARAAAPVGERKGLIRASWALADQCVVSGANFLTIFIYARYLDTTYFGVFMLAHTGLLLVTSMQNALIVQPHNVLAAGLAPAEYRRVTTGLAALQVLCCVGLCLALALAGWGISVSGAPAAGSVIVALAVTAAPWMGQEFIRRVLYTRAETRSATINDAVTYGLQLAGAAWVAVAWSAHVTPETALYVLGGSSAVGALLGTWQLRHHLHFGRGVSASYARTWSEVWHFGKWLTAQNGTVWLGSHGHAWIVGLLLGAEQVGLYRAVTHLINVMNPLRQAAYAYLPSRGSVAYQSDGAAGLERWVKKTWWMLLAALLPFCVVLIGFPMPVIEAAYGERYAIPMLAAILALATAGQCLTFLKFPYDIGLLALRATKVIFQVHLIPMALLFTTGVAFIHYWGIVGVPLSALVINLSLLSATAVAYRRMLRKQPAQPADAT